MKTQIKILLNESNPHKQGSCFERLVRSIIETHRYEVHSNVNLTGMEIDLIAQHKDRKGEKLYVECKAKQKVSADEITKFAFNTSHKRADFGYFIRTQELEHQAAGLLEEFEGDDRYKNLTFIEPSKVIELLESSSKVLDIDLTDKPITQRTLIISDDGDYFFGM